METDGRERGVEARTEGQKCQDREADAIAGHVAQQGPSARLLAIRDAPVEYPRINLASIPGDEVLRDSPLEAGQRLVSYVVTVRDHNTREWLEGLAEEVNRWAESTGDPDRVKHVNGAIRIVRIVG